MSPPEIPNQADNRLTINYERLSPAGQLATFSARSLDMVLSKDGKTLYVKEHTGLRVIDTATWTEKGHLDSKGGGSLTGLALSPDGRSLLFTNTDHVVYVFRLAADGSATLDRDIDLSKTTSFPCGLCFAPNGRSFFVCLSVKNQLAEVAWPSGEVKRTIPVGIAPYEVAVSSDGRTAYVSCQGGRNPRDAERTAKSRGTPVPVDERGIASTGIVSVVELEAGREADQISVGLQPSAVAWLGNRNLLAVANANQDSVSIIDISTNRVASTIIVKPDAKLPFGSMPNGLTASTDGKILYVSLAGNNAVAIFDVTDLKHPKMKGHLPTAWYPGALVLDDANLYIANVKGLGALQLGKPRDDGGKNSRTHTGAVQKVPLSYDLRAGTAVVKRNARVPEIMRALDASGQSTNPVPVPSRLGDPSVFQHVVYVIKENRTYDQVFGDMKEGDGDPKLCTFGEAITPNHHALARQFGLLDNYYCNGVLSADGHAWAIEGNVTPYLEREFGGFSRSYDYGTDPLTYSSSGFIWEPILAKGLSFRNFGEMDFPEVPKGWTMDGIWRNYEKGQDTVFSQRVEIDRLRDYTSRTYPGWNMAIPDQLRMDRFLTEFREWEKSGLMPNFVIVYLPQDHTAGTTPGYPKTTSYVADNDLAVGKLVDALSHSQFWKDTVVFANEDDPQAGFDHVDGNRSLCLVASPYSKRGKTIGKFYNQNSVLHTILRIFRIPAMNQKVASAPLMTDCFQSKPNLHPFEKRDPQVDLNALNPPLEKLRGPALRWAKLSQTVSFKDPDFPSLKQDDLMNRILWFDRMGSIPYPSRFAGSHGRGLAKKGLKREAGTRKDDD